MLRPQRTVPRWWRLAMAIGAVGAIAVSHASVSDSSFANWLLSVREEAATGGVSKSTLDLVLQGVVFESRVVELQGRQPESHQTFRQYMSTRASPQRLEKARAELARHRDLLDRVADKYGVQPRFVIALWALESDFGRDTGRWSTIQSLASLAYGGRRREYFRRELIAALMLVESMPERWDMTGSWAGAVGQCQFMPSNVRRLAVDFDGDGRVDVWDSLPDVFASIANFLSKNSWRDDQTWGREVSLPGDFDRRLAGHEVRMRLPRWADLGARRADGGPLPTRPLWTSLVLPDGSSGRSFLVYENFRSVLKWNRSNHFALSVGLLSDGIR